MSSALIPRRQPKSEASGCIFFTNGKNIRCIYTDYEINLALDINGNKTDYENNYLTDINKHLNQLVLVTAIIDGNNTITNRKKIEGKPDKGFYFLNSNTELRGTNFIFPVGYSQLTISKIYDKFLQWVNLEIQ